MKEKKKYTRNENRKNGNRRDSFTFKWTVTNEQLIRNDQPIKAAFDAPTRRFEL